MSTTLLDAVKDHLDLGESPENVKLAWSGTADAEKTEFFDLLLMETLLVDTLGARRLQAAPPARLPFTRMVKMVGVAALLMIVVGVFCVWRQASRYREPELVIGSTGTGSATLQSPRRGETIKSGPAEAKLTMGGYCDLSLDPGTEIILRGEPHKEAVELLAGRVVSEITPQKGGYTVYTPLGWVRVKGTRFTTTVEHPSASKAGGTRPLASATVTVSVAAGEVEYQMAKESGVLRGGETRLFAQAPPAKPAAPPAAGPEVQAKPPAPQPVALQVQAKLELTKTLSLPIGNGVKMDFVLIQPGTFMMGEQKTEHQEVAITKPFYIGVYEVTQAQWKAVMVDNPASWKGDDLPVGEVSWEDCLTFLDQLTEKFAGMYTFRLPTEAEWEYACRAGTKTLYSFGDDEASLGEYAWYGANSENQTHPVGKKKPNPWGLYDMHGNVSEFCSDWLRPYGHSAVTDPKGPPTGTLRVVRGGTCINRPWRCQSANRQCLDPAARWGNAGLRVVCTEAEDAAGKPEGRIGVYDSRAVAIAFVGSEAFRKWMGELKAEQDKAKAAGDVKRMAELEAEGAARQKQLHKQGFSTAPVDDILERIKDSLIEIKQKAGVAALVSKWDRETLAKHSSAEHVDVTMALVDAFHPDERQRKSAVEIQGQEPVPLDQVEKDEP